MVSKRHIDREREYVCVEREGRACECVGQGRVCSRDSQSSGWRYVSKILSTESTTACRNCTYVRSIRKIAAILCRLPSMPNSS